jgi:hypothetical protein
MGPRRDGVVHASLRFRMKKKSPSTTTIAMRTYHVIPNPVASAGGGAAGATVG